MLLSDKDPPHVQLQLVIPRIIGGIEILRGSIGYIQNTGKHHLAIGIEMNPVHGRIGLLTQALIEIHIILLI